MGSTFKFLGKMEILAVTFAKKTEEDKKKKKKKKKETLRRGEQEASHSREKSFFYSK